MKSSTRARLVLFGIFFIIIACILLFSSCSPSHRLARLIKHNPDLITRDTIFTPDTTIVASVQSDTSFIWQHDHDTVSVTKIDSVTGKVKLRYTIIHDHDTVRVTAECRGDTIIKNIPVIVNTIQPAPGMSLFNCICMWIGRLALVAVALMVGYGFYMNKKRPG